MRSAVRDSFDHSKSWFFLVFFFALSSSDILKQNIMIVIKNLHHCAMQAHKIYNNKN